MPILKARFALPSSKLLSIVMVCDACNSIIVTPVIESLITDIFGDSKDVMMIIGECARLGLPDLIHVSLL